MKQTAYKFGTLYFRAKCAPVGKGWEVSVTFDKKTIFVGNFIYRAEATAWWNVMNREIRQFTKTYWIANKNAKGWYGKFLSTHLYKMYYRHLDKMFTKYSRTYKHAFSKNVRRYNTLRRGWKPYNKFHLTKAA